MNSLISFQASVNRGVCPKPQFGMYELGGDTDLPRVELQGKLKALPALHNAKVQPGWGPLVVKFDLAQPGSGPLARQKYELLKSLDGVEEIETRIPGLNLLVYAATNGQKKALVLELDDYYLTQAWQEVASSAVPDGGG